MSTTTTVNDVLEGSRHARRDFVLRHRDRRDHPPPCGEYAQCIGTDEIALEESKGKAPVLGGAGGYNTREVIELARDLERLGVDGILSVTPYYNKPTQEGLYQHYKAIAAAIQVPIIVYRDRKS